MEKPAVYSDFFDDAVQSVEELMKAEQQQLGSVAQYVDTCVSVFQHDSSYQRNMEQLEQMARIITGPFVGMGGHDYASELYWGETLGMAVGDHYFGTRWSDALYRIMNQYFSARRATMPFRQAQSDELVTVPLPEKARNLEEALAIADDALDMLEREKFELPDRYQELIAEWSKELSMTDMGRYFITVGFNFLVNIAFAQAKYEEQLAATRPAPYSDGYSLAA